MAIDVPTFLARFPEFKDAGAVFISVQLTRALHYVPDCPWGLHKEEGAFLYCARFLALSPYGRKLNLVNKKGETNYDKDLQRITHIVTSGFRVT